MACLLLMLALSCARAEEMPEWTYALPPEILDNSSGYITLTNRESLLDEAYAPTDLTPVTAKRVVKGCELRKEANEALNRMFEAALAQGHTLYVKSAYRSYQTQKTMYYNRLDKYGKDDGVVAYPGSSDHQTGLGVDILNYEWTQKEGMTAAFGETDEAKWMAENCQDYGFVIRYMEDKEEITGIVYEPWHLRYVGDETAAYMTENHLSLEEFTKEWQDYLAEYAALGGDFEELLRQRARLNPVTVVDVADDGEEEVSIFY